MAAIVRSLSTHSDRLERWLGAEQLARVSTAMRTGGGPANPWYGPPIAMSGVPGRVYATADGDYVGRIHGGRFAAALDYQYEKAGRAYKRWVRRQRSQVNAGFASLSDLISEATAGAKLRTFPFNKSGPTRVVGSASTLWRLGNYPPAGAAGAAAPGGTAHSKSDTGAFPFTNPSGGDTQHFIGANIFASSVGTVLLYDRLFSVAKTINSTSTEAVSGVPTRYQSTTSTDPDYVGGNFLFVNVTATQLANTAHNWTVCQYTNQAGSTGQSIPSFAGNPGGVATIVDRFDMPVNTWFVPLNGSDTGIKALSQMQCSALVATGSCDFVIGHPIAWMTIYLANLATIVDGINSALNLTRIFDNACLAFIEVSAAATTANTYNGSFTTCAG